MVRIAALSLALLMSSAALAAAQDGDRRGGRAERGDGQRPNGGGGRDRDGGRPDSGQRPNGWAQRQADGDRRGGGEVRREDGQRGWRDQGQREEARRFDQSQQRPNGWGQRNPEFRSQTPQQPPAGQGFARRDGGNDYGLRGGDGDRRRYGDGGGDRGGDRRWTDRGRDDDRRDGGRRDDGRRDDGRRDWGANEWNGRGGQDWRRDDRGHNDWGRNDWSERRYAHGGDRYRDRDRGRSWYEPRHFHQHYRATYRYRAPVYIYPSGYFVRHWTYGEYLPRGWYGPSYYLDWRAFGLPFPPIGCEWVRVGSNALLVDVWSGQILSIYYDLFW